MRKLRIVLFIILKSVALCTVFSIYFEPRMGFATINSTHDIVSVTYLPGWKDKNATIYGAIRFKLSPGWKTYWKNPGPFGVRPSFDWSSSKNIQSIEFLWPTPKVFNQDKIQVIGYRDILTIPIKISKKNSIQKALLNMNVEFGVCSDICLIKQAKIIENLNPRMHQKNVKLIKSALKTIPSKSTNQILSFSKCTVQIDKGDVNVTYSMRFNEPPNSKPTMIIKYESSHEYIENQMLTTEGHKLVVKASLNGIYKDQGIIERDRLTALLITGNKGFEIVGCN